MKLSIAGSLTEVNATLDRLVKPERDVQQPPDPAYDDRMHCTAKLLAQTPVPVGAHDGAHDGAQVELQAKLDRIRAFAARLKVATACYNDCPDVAWWFSRTGIETDNVTYGELVDFLKEFES